MFDSIMTMVQSAQDSGANYTLDIMSIASVVGMWKMLEKAGEPGWSALIPFYNMYKFCGAVMGNPWYWLRFFVFIIPIIGWIAGLYFMYEMGKATAKAFGKPEGWAWGYLLLTGIFYCITGFDQSEYYGPYGVSDNRTAQAKQSKTVSFDVVKNQPARAEEPQVRPAETIEPVTPVEPVTPLENAAPKAEEVEFIFDQPEE